MNRIHTAWAWLKARAAVVAKAAPTWLTGLSVVLTIVSEELAEVLPAGAAETVGRLVILATAWIGAAVSIIRRVTPVPTDERGIMSTPGSLDARPSAYDHRR